MAGTVHALLFKAQPHDALPTVSLTARSGLTLLPLTEDVVARTMPGAADSPPVAGFYNLTTGIAEWARQHSRHGDVAYIHTEFFGGDGFHAAMAWRAGEIALGPLFTETSPGEAEAHYTTVTDRHDMAVNVVLRWFGVQRADHIDEYAAAGLNRHRWTEEWAALLTR